MEAKKQRIEYASYILGTISFVLLGRMIGDNGVTYMAVIMECISLFVLLAGGGTADLTGRLLRSRKKKNLYRDAAQTYRTIWIIQTVAATVLMILYFILSAVAADKIFHMDYLTAAMRILTPVILLRTWNSVLAGYFQGAGIYVPTVVSCVFRQLFFLLFGLLFTGRLMGYGEKVSALLNNPDYAGMYGAVGLSVSMLVSELLITVFMLIVYIGSDKSREHKKAEEGLQQKADVGQRCRLVCVMYLPEGIRMILKRLPLLLTLLLILGRKQEDSSAVYEYGMFFRCFVCICAVPILLFCVRITHPLNRLTALVKKKDNRSLREVICTGMHYCWTVGLFGAVTGVVLAPQISKLLNPESAELLQGYYTYGGALIPVVILNIFLLKVLIVMGRRLSPWLVLILFPIVFVPGVLLLGNSGMERIGRICIAALIAGGVQLLAAFTYIIRKYVLQPDVTRCFLIPMIGAAASGLLTILARNLLAPHLGNLICFVLCLILNLIVYMVVLVATKSIRESEIGYLYGNTGRKVWGILLRY